MAPVGRAALDRALETVYIYGVTRDGTRTRVVCTHFYRVVSALSTLSIQFINIPTTHDITVNNMWLFIYSLFNDAFSIWTIYERMTVSNELERMWKEAVVA
jgi:hypothetical protein